MTEGGELVQREPYVPFVPQPAGFSYFNVSAAQSELEAAKTQYLKRWGWEQTCSTPGSFWLWRRDFADHDSAMAKVHIDRKLPSKHVPYGVVPYGVVAVPTDLAVSMTLSALDEQLELAGDEG